MSTHAPTLATGKDTPLEKAYSKVFWRIVPFIMLCYVVAYLDRVNVGFAKLQMSQDLGFSETVFGLGAGLFFIGYFFFEVPSNAFLHRVGARVWIARIMITWGLISGCFMFVETPTQFYIARFLLGAAEAGFYPGIILYLTYWYPAHRRARIVALFMSAIPIAGIFGNPLSGWIMDTFAGVKGMAGWQWMFVIEAIPAVIVGIMVLFILRNGIRDAKWLTENEMQLLEAEVAADQKHTESNQSFGSLLKSGRVWAMCGIYFCIVMGQYALTFWMPTFIKASGITGNLKIGMISAIPFLVAVVVMNIIGRSSDKHRERRWHLIVPAVAAAVSFAIVASFAGNTVVSVIALSIAAAGVLTCSPLFWSLPTAFLSGAAAAVGIAMINSVGNLAGFVSPYLIGYLKDLTQSTASGMYLLAAVLLVGAVLIYLTPAKLVNR
ncbi:MFS transporter [Pigmentiphaga aceris]|uniref:Putative tartrate transporter n=1 Tax=Pigmentiphaga aceris TaxID=1940612 RepID=A0A5C0B3P4_9BURK|nr:MFS transporter [Pigmentiphaga aceris]QEI08283.1 MFS transporter [Pigmentiphaga aceris]